jgi:calcineurin-like phosphoesterase family protein
MIINLDMVANIENVFVTADLHLGDSQLVDNHSRPFFATSDMDKVVIERWNKAVGPDDWVYVLGDFTARDGEAATAYFKKLNGCIDLIPGAGDHRWLEDFYLQAKSLANGSLQSPDFVSANGRPIIVLPPVVTLETTLSQRHQPAVVVLSHYPMRAWDRSRQGAIHLYGNAHGVLWPDQLGETEEEKHFLQSLDVGMDCHDFRPIPLNVIANPFHPDREKLRRHWYNLEAQLALEEATQALDRILLQRDQELGLVYQKLYSQVTPEHRRVDQQTRQAAEQVMEMIRQTLTQETQGIEPVHPRPIPAPRRDRSNGAVRTFAS